MRSVSLIPAILILLAVAPTSSASVVYTVNDGPVFVDAFLPTPGPIVPAFKQGQTAQVVVIHTVEVGDIQLTCVFQPNDPSSAYCRACVGPGETQYLPVEFQGEGIAVGIPGEPGFYAAEDVLGGRASCD